MGQILVVDDHHESRRALLALVKGFHGPAIGAESGPEALRILEDADVGLVFLDWGMPGMSGLEVLQFIRAQPRHAALAVVMYTAMTDLDHRQAALDAGAQEYVSKGDFDGLVRALKRFAGDKPKPN